MSAPKNKTSGNEPEDSVPKAVVNRLSLYLRELQLAVKSGHETTSSSQLGSLLGFSDAQVRKDLAYFGQFGYPGIGYRCTELIEAIRKILGTDRLWRVAVVGVGNLGRALLGYKGFSRQGFELVAAFDVDPARVVTKIEGVDIYHLDQLTEITKAKAIKLAMIAVPAPAAQQVADCIAAAGIEGVVNFAPVTITLPDHISQVGVDLAIELEQLAFSALKRARSGYSSAAGR